MIPSSCLFFKVGADVFFNVFFGLAIEGRMGYTTWELFFVYRHYKLLAYTLLGFFPLYSFFPTLCRLYEWSVCLYP